MQQLGREVQKIGEAMAVSLVGWMIYENLEESYMAIYIYIMVISIYHGHMYIYIYMTMIYIYIHIYTIYKYNQIYHILPTIIDGIIYNLIYCIYNYVYHQLMIPLVGEDCHRYDGFLKWGIPNSWMVCRGKYH